MISTNTGLAATPRKPLTLSKRAPDIICSKKEMGYYVQRLFQRQFDSRSRLKPKDNRTLSQDSQLKITSKPS